jgi:hypothetical protein
MHNKVGSTSNEDSLRLSSISKPLSTSHPTCHSKLSDPFSVQLTNSLELFNDHHNQVLIYSKEALKGAIMGILAAQFNSLANRSTIYQGYV